MCGRFYIASEDSAEELQAIIDSLQRKTNAPVKTGEIRPTDDAPVIANSKSLTPSPFLMRWGYSLRDRPPVINARSETAADRALFRDGMTQRRCLVPASHYFEWERIGNRKIKNAIKPAGSRMMCMAGLYRIEQGRPEFTILTREPAECIRHIHDRMPVILPREALGDWMNPHYAANDVIKVAMVDMQFQPETDNLLSHHW